MIEILKSGAWMKSEHKYILILIGVLMFFTIIWLIFDLLLPSDLFNFGQFEQKVFHLIGYTSFVLIIPCYLVVAIILRKYEPKVDEQIKWFLKAMKKVKKIQKIGFWMMIIGTLLIATFYIIPIYTIIITGTLEFDYAPLIYISSGIAIVGAALFLLTFDKEKRKGAKTFKDLFRDDQAPPPPTSPRVTKVKGFNQKQGFMITTIMIIFIIITDFITNLINIIKVPLLEHKTYYLSFLFFQIIFYSLIIVYGNKFRKSYFLTNPNERISKYQKKVVICLLVGIILATNYLWLYWSYFRPYFDAIFGEYSIIRFFFDISMRIAFILCFSGLMLYVLRLRIEESPIDK